MANQELFGEPVKSTRKELKEMYSKPGKLSVFCILNQEILTIKCKPFRFFFNLVEKNMFHYQLVFKKSYTRFTIH